MAIDRKKLIIFFVLAVLFAWIILPTFSAKNRVYEHYTGDESNTSLTDIDVEALQNLSSMYNNDTGTLTINNLKISGDLNVGGTTTVSGPTYSKHYAFSGSYDSRSDVPDDTAIYEYNNRVNEFSFFICFCLPRIFR